MNRFFVIAMMIAGAATMLFAATAPDSLGVVGNLLLAKLAGYGIGPGEIAGIMTFVVGIIGAGLRALQRYLQGRKTIWRYVDNKLTTSLINRIIGHLFGKTTLIYGSKIECDEKDREAALAAAAALTAKHMLRKNGSDMLNAFARAMANR